MVTNKMGRDFSSPKAFRCIPRTSLYPDGLATIHIAIWVTKQDSPPTFPSTCIPLKYLCLFMFFILILNKAGFAFFIGVFC